MTTQPTTQTEPQVVDHASPPAHLDRTTKALAVLIAWWAVSPRARLLAVAQGRLGEA